MTLLIGLGLVAAFFMLPLPTICAAVGTMIAGLPGAIVGAIIGFILSARI